MRPAVPVMHTPYKTHQIAPESIFSGNPAKKPPLHIQINGFRRPPLTSSPVFRRGRMSRRRFVQAAAAPQSRPPTDGLWRPPSASYEGGRSLERTLPPTPSTRAPEPRRKEGSTCRRRGRFCRLRSHCRKATYRNPPRGCPRHRPPFHSRLARGTPPVPAPLPESIRPATLRPRPSAPQSGLTRRLTCLNSHPPSRTRNPLTMPQGNSRFSHRQTSPPHRTGFAPGPGVPVNP